ncbi:MAG: prolipoprotein diacylglyceryl transferase, partial [Caldilineales bacterium]|nr:prolipoprotein diacylglyceryl transferase [Caldilineales bacterium]
MIPTLQIGRLALPTGPLLIILGFYLALWLAARVGARRGLAPDHLYNAGFYAALIGLLAGRVGHILRFFPAYRADPASMLSPNLAAFLWPAGVGAGLLMLLWYQRRQRLPALAYADALALGALLLLA